MPCPAAASPRPSSTPSRLAPARRRARMLKIASAGVAVAGFGALSLLVRSGTHTGSPTASDPSTGGSALELSSRISQEAATAAHSSAPARTPLELGHPEPVVQSSAGLHPHLMSPRRFKAMGCEIVVGGATPSEQVAVERLFAALEASLSRFRPTSDLERLNRSPAETVIVSPLLATALDDALRAAPRPTASATRRSPPRSSRRATTDLCGDRARPARRTRRLRAVGARSGSPASSSGDRLAYGSISTASSRDARSTTPWRCSRATASSRPAATWRRAVSSSSRFLPAAPYAPLGRARHERHHDAVMGKQRRPRSHHLIHPSTGCRPTYEEAVTVCAGTCLAADVAAKTAFLLGNDGPAWIERQGLQGRFVAETEVVLAGGWPESTEPRYAPSRLLDDRLVRRPRRRGRLVPVDLGERARRHPARRQEAHPRSAPLCGRGRPPVPRAPRRTVHRDSRRLDRPRHRRALLAEPARDPVHG